MTDQPEEQDQAGADRAGSGEDLNEGGYGGPGPEQEVTGTAGAKNNSDKDQPEGSGSQAGKDKDRMDADDVKEDGSEPPD